ncbi:hypothetical protein M409DRAFT_22638 [Zasmidium cellare ATCC 36951]|uniref:N-acetyltransferase domain-containing protein n=1 Tax=Zasmidium cellare ATCC 36951 TaxID=1080233 RepID=A0A6A6CN93_ZASCE|nr:uncharacterized protein M409DRAFT_22638 [Zasmidium cellare ATCC 36951]KAF2167209.1 hypothetical protein M409DRAFT_22638 [Zasmidium cellare ATCC 36951]
MHITIHPLPPTEIPTFITIELAAFAPHPRIPMLWPRGYTPDLHAYMARVKREAFPSPSNHFIKAVDSDTGEIVGVSQFEIKEEGDEAGELLAEDAPPPGDWPEGGNWGMKRFFARESWRLVEGSFGRGAHVVIDLLLIHPTHQHRGIGSQLLQHVLEEADSRNIPVGLESTPAGLALYKRHGFVETRVIKADMRAFGWREEYDEEAAKRVWMVRDKVGGREG